MAQSGKVYLVGAGPGDPELLTIKALRLIENSDVVVYDRLVSPQILSLIPDGTDRVDVGKRPGLHPVPQEAINSILVRLARAGQSVVRLKGGDPMIFGRGGEEALALGEHNIEVETIPGITAAQGCAASLNLPLTHRRIAQSLVYLTGHACEGKMPDLDWAHLATSTSTLAIYMGAAKIDEIIARLMAAGMDPNTPAMAVCNGTMSHQSNISARISEIPNLSREQAFDGPVLFLIGPAVGLMEQSKGKNVVCPVENSSAMFG